MILSEDNFLEIVETWLDFGYFVRFENTQNPAWRFVSETSATNRFMMEYYLNMRDT